MRDDSQIFQVTEPELDSGRPNSLMRKRLHETVTNPPDVCAGSRKNPAAQEGRDGSRLFCASSIIRLFIGTFSPRLGRATLWDW
jgi:hypothetical protein